MLLISDANILIDMSVAGLLEAMFSLPESFAVPDVLFAEELSERHPELLSFGLKTLVLDGAGVREAYMVKTSCTGRTAPSLNDVFALMLAKQVGGVLLTGDRRLRELAETRYSDIEVRGTLWIMQRLQEQGLLEAAAAREAYWRMRQSGSRLPWGEVNRQLEEWDLDPF
jgi:hypothetical protein